MSCETAGNNATPPSPAVAPGVEAIDPRRFAEQLAARPGGPADQRVREILPAFDAPFFQAGLAGYSDAAMRIIARRHGCPYCITEALLDRTMLAGGRGFAKADLGELHDNIPGGAEDAPLACQIMGSDPREMAAAALKAAEQGRRGERAYRLLAYEVQGVLPSTHASARGVPAPPRMHLRLPGGEQLPPFTPQAEGADDTGGAEDAPAVAIEHSFAAIDVNLACPVKKIERKARGGHWLAEPEGAIAILEAVREAVPAGIPCTVKLRRSFDDTPEMAANADRILSAAFDIGYAWATIHARTVQQKYIGPSRWDILRDIVNRHRRGIIFGSGDVWEVADIFRMIAYTGVAGAAVARGCIGNPWIFRQARDMLAGRAPRPPSIAEQRAVLDEHFRLLLAVCAPMRQPEQQAGKLIRKFGIRFAAHHPESESVRRAVIGVHSLEDWQTVLRTWYIND